ncbi:MAG TPA: HD domain-containing protein [Polyangiaceae bacterium]|jgi:poly(A) polymerase|nr:HD domain-containing protein [Polyangiaceae bacterium]
MPSTAETLPPSPLPVPRIVDADADRARELLGFALVCAHRPGKELAEGALGVPLRVLPEDVRAMPKAELRERLDEILLGRRADLGLLALQQGGLLEAVFPEVTQLMGFGEGDNLHKDVWRHTLQVVIQAVPRLSVRWAALFHDIGKPRTRSVAADGTVHFLHHAEAGARMFERIRRREKLFPEEQLAEAIQFLIYHHQRAHQYEESWTDSATRRFAREIGEQLQDLLALSRADMTTKRKEKRRKFLFQLKAMGDRIEALLAEDNKPKALPKGLGEELMRAFGLPPSKLVGDMRKELELAVESGELPGLADFELYIGFVRQNPERFRLPAPAAQQ